jgi:hypothetical protein
VKTLEREKTKLESMDEDEYSNPDALDEEEMMEFLEKVQKAKEMEKKAKKAMEMTDSDFDTDLEEESSKLKDLLCYGLV